MQVNAKRRSETILTLARAVISGELGRGGEWPDIEGARWLLEPGAVFVTLTQGETLRGCMGTVEAWRPLLEDVRENALAAAFRDPRFPPLRPVDLSSVRIEISELSPLEEIHFTSETEAQALLRPKVDGVALDWNGRRGTFLPQVWAHYPDRAAFLTGLKRKAGLSAHFWDSGVRLYRYTVVRHTEPTPVFLAAMVAAEVAAEAVR
ncbi:MAG: AmmeMemoRadiSam system protein A [Nitrospirota bacterium]|nr:AmmeMemoRadiSam system protein A [Nitrospirota bacterium]